MPVITAPSKEEAQQLLEHDVAAKCAVAFQCGCRLAVYVLAFVNEPSRTLISYDFKVLSPGETASAGWTIYEERSGRAVGRSA